ncbi:MAG: hypothetical protein KDE48_02350 [Anaerolineales bacterium]|nr:hypothetical protein [Anaerolineales bacterium]
MIPYLLMALLYVTLALLAALETSFAGLNILPWFNGMVWLRVHFITLGALTQLFFGVLPAITAIRFHRPRPAIRWDIWATLNSGIALLLIGIPLVNRVPIIAGGTLIFIATILLMLQLFNMRAKGQTTKKAGQGHAGRKFYIVGLAYFLLGILIGTGLWTGWIQSLGVVGNAKEVHIHANNWGLLSMVFAGLLVDLYPVWAKRPLANPKSITPIFWMMTLGAFGLIFGPWLANTYLLVPGLLLHLAATIWLLANVIKPIWGDLSAWTAGMSHLIFSYVWLLLPILMAPIVLFGVGSLPGEIIEANAPQALIYGWALQFSYAIIPYFFRRVFLPDTPAKLGGTWLSFATINLGAIFLWASIFIVQLNSVLHGIAYLLWVISLLPILVDLWKTTRDGMSRLEQDSALA